MNPITWLVSLFNKVQATIQPFLSKVFNAAMNAFIAKLWETAVEAVEAAGKLEDLSNAEKRKEAVKRVIESAKANGIEYKDSMVNLLVEMAVAYWKSLQE